MTTGQFKKVKNNPTVAVAQVLSCTKAGAFVAQIVNPETLEILHEIEIWSSEGPESVELHLRFDAAALNAKFHNDAVED